MPVTHRAIPTLPACPRARSIAADIRRSYPTGRQAFSRALAGTALELTISSGEPLPVNVRATLVTTINADREGKWTEAPFVRRDEKTLVCSTIPARPGLFSFRTKFTIDGGATWLRDPVPDAWVLVDPPQVDRLRMYTLIPNVSGTIADWSEQLKHIAAMGFNAVHLLPLTTLDTSASPYSARDLFDVDPSYLALTDAGSEVRPKAGSVEKESGSSEYLGTGLGGDGLNGLAQLEAFIANAKALDMRLCFDLVMNHVGPDSNIARRAPEWIMPDPANPDGLRRARYWSDKGWQPWDDLVLIDYEHPSQQVRADVRNYMTEYALFWAGYASETNGFVRFDNLHSSDKPFVDALTVALRSEYPNVGIIAEYFTDAATLLTTVPTWGLNLILATPWDNRFVPQLRDYIKYIHSIAGHVRFFMPVTSHDSGSPAQEFGSVQSTIPRYIAAALLGTGATGVTQGVEWGVKEKIAFIGKREKLTHAGEPMFGDFLKRVNAIAAEHPAFRRGENCQFVDNGHHAVIAAFRKDDRPGKAGFLVICNFDILHEHAFEADLSAMLGGKGPVNCVDLLTGEKKTFASAQVCLVLPVCGAFVLMF